MRSLLNLEKRERSLNFEEPRHRISHGRTPSVHVLPFSGVLYCFLVCSILIVFYCAGLRNWTYTYLALK